MLCIVIVTVSFGYFSQMRLNRFSKNIIFSSNYFLRNFGHEYSKEPSAAPVPTYTLSEAEAITQSLVENSGLLFLKNSWIFNVYRPDRELNKNDIIAYYYNYMINMFVSLGEPYVLFSPEITEILTPSGDTGAAFSRYEVITTIKRLVEHSFNWTPSRVNYISPDGFIYVDYSEENFYVHEEIAECDGYLSHEKHFDNLKSSIVRLATELIDNDTAHGAEYTYSEVCQVYFKSISESLLESNKFLSVEEVLDFLDEYESNAVRPRILDAENISQLPEYPNGCEAVSAVMLLRYAGYDVSKTEFIEDHLEKGEMKIRFGIRFGPDPVEKYAGDPASEKGGWGCFAPAIVNALKSYLSSAGSRLHTPVNVSGAELSVLCESFIDRSIPVAIWITQDYSPVNEVYQWLDYDGNKVYLYPKNQHCVMLMGYDSENYYICDPLKKENCTAVPREDAEISYTSMGSQAVVLISNEQ